MGKKTKRRPPPVKTGIARQYLGDNFSEVPGGQNEVKNGHILEIYLNNERSVTRTIAAIRLKYGENCGITQYQIISLVDQTLEKYRHLTREAELSEFQQICQEQFFSDQHTCTHSEDSPDKLASPGALADVAPDICADVVMATAMPCGPDLPIQSPEPSTSAGHDVPMIESPEPSPSACHDVVAMSESPEPSTSAGHDVPIECPEPSTPAVSYGPDISAYPIRSVVSMTPRKVSLKKRLDFVSKSASDMKKKYSKEIGTLKAQLKTPRRVINQALERKNNTIDNKKAVITGLKNKYKRNPLVRELAEAKQQLGDERKKHKKYLKRNKEARATSVSKKEYEKLKAQLQEKVETIKQLEHEKMLLEETVDDLTSSSDATGITAKRDRKTYSSATRLKVFDCIVNQVPTSNVPNLIQQFSNRSGETIDHVPHRNTVELMARELGVIAELQTAETIVENKNVTLGFDATTQEGVHVNSIHFTTKLECVAAAVDELPGGTADDYANHVTKTVDNLGETYAYFHKKDYQESRKALIANISNTLTDRCAANGAAIRLINATWKKHLNELNCHLHPLDSIASATRSALKKLEETRGALYGKDCLAANIVWQMNRLRFKDGKGDPRGFVCFLDKKKLPRGIIPRYRGNRLHILFHIAGIFIEHYEIFQELLTSGTACGGLRSSILKDFCNKTAVLELRVLGLLGKFLSGPWMKKFYVSAQSGQNHVEGILIVRKVLTAVNDYAQRPLDLLTQTVDLFGDALTMDTTLEKLKNVPEEHQDQFCEMMTKCLSAVSEVLNRQYARYFSMDITEVLKEEAESARMHNIDAEEVMGMFSAAQKRAPNATLCYLSCQMRSRKNRTVKYLDGLSEERREEVLRMAVKFGRKRRDQRRKAQKDLRMELLRRQEKKKHQQDTVQRKKLEKRLAKFETELDSILEEFPDADRDQLLDILEGRVVGRTMCHIWALEGELTMYNGRVKKLKPGNKGLYRVAYWSQEEDYSDATDWDVSKYELAVDFLHDDVSLSY